MTYWPHSDPGPPVHAPHRVHAATVAACRAPGCDDGDVTPRPVTRGYTVCRPCGGRLFRALAELPTRHAALAAALHPSGGAAVAGRISGGGEASLPIREAVANHRHHIGELLASWVGMVAEQRQATPPAGRDVPTLAGWLARHVAWLCRHPAGPDAHAEITAAWSRARSLTDTATPTRFPVGPCPAPGCDGRVWAHLPRAGGGLSSMGCEACENTWDVTQWLRAGVRILARRDTLHADARSA